MKRALVTAGFLMLLAGCHSERQMSDCRGRYMELAKAGQIPVTNAHRDHAVKEAMGLDLAELFGWRAMTPKEAYEACLGGEL